MRLFDASFTTIILRFNLMMALIGVGIATGFYALAFLGLPVFLTCLLGVSFGKEKQKVEVINHEINIKDLSFQKIKTAA